LKSNFKFLNSMMMKSNTIMNKFTMAVFLVFISLNALLSQATGTPAAQPAPAPKPVDHSYKPMTLKISEDGSKFIRLITWHQVWTTFTQNNPGTLDVNGKDIGGKTSFDVAMRRSRFLIQAQVSPRFMILTHWGINNQSFINGGAGNHTAGVTPSVSNQGKKPQLYIHDAWTEFAVQPGKLHIGGGLHYWNGVSRLSSNSTLNFMTMDAPIFNWFNIEATDQFARQYGLYAKGQLGKLDYRLSINKPFINGTAASALTAAASGKEVAVNTFSEKPAFQGYADYMIWDKESNVLPFFVGSYLGTKKVFNIGAGFYSQGEATATRITGVTDSIRRHNEMVFGADVFIDMPTRKGKGDCLNFLLTYYNMDFGPRYIRNVGILNEHATAAAATDGKTADSWSGGGNLQPTIGTGSIIYAQLGYAFPKNKTGHQWMPYATFTHKKFDRLADPSNQMGLGVNWFITGHNAKITAEYATRPVYKLNSTSGAIENNGSKGQMTIQMHVFL
jgi:hypothetical protein